MADSPSIDYHALFQALPGSYLLLAPDGTVLDNSDQHVAVSLLPRAQAVGRDIFAAYPSAPESQQELAASHEQVRRTLRPDTMPLLRYDLERPAEQGGGTEERYWQITHYPLLDGHGQLQYILQMPQDVTEQHRAALHAAQVQTDLDEAQDRTRFILENLPVLIWTSDATGERDYLNSRWLAFTGKPLGRQTGWQWTEDLHPEDQARVLEVWQHSLATGDLYQVEYRLRRHDDQYRWILVRAVPRRDDAGRITMWVGGATDIHDQRQMVQELLVANEQQAALSDQAYQLYQKAESQRETYESLFQQAPAMICVLRGPEHHYEFVNPRYQQLFPHRQLLGRTVAEAVPEVKDQGFIDILDNVYQTGETFHGNELKMQLERDASGVLKDTYFNFIYQRFRENGQPAGIMVFAFEVTDFVRARQVLEKLRDTAANAIDEATAG
ncbi:PAS domain-containing protein [Hymenobacter terricola]|uniref:PAS domain-containing protein n=1 Tax=Hymenobacter terricola TaxID=2819236 RepID=UPI001B3028C6|nr:PAS domain-containing protein [Hymenobacter terricola]